MKRTPRSDGFRPDCKCLRRGAVVVGCLLASGGVLCLRLFPFLVVSIPCETEAIKDLMAP